MVGVLVIDQVVLDLVGELYGICFKVVIACDNVLDAFSAWIVLVTCLKILLEVVAEFY